MKLRRKLALSVLLATGGLLMGGSAGATLSLPGWAGAADPFDETRCWHQGYGRLYYNADVCGDVSVYDDFDIPIPIKTYPGFGGNDLTVSWETGTDCPTCLGALRARVLVFKPDGTQYSASSWIADFVPHNVVVTVPVNGSVMLWVEANGTLNTTYVKRVSTSGTLSL